MIIGRPIALSVGSAPPSEFRLFTKGWNETEKGRFLFDDEAARSVLAAYSAWGVDLVVDLEHQSLELAGGESPDATARDARGWFKLQLRPDGSLWAVSATWTPDGAQRLTEKRQRYISPAFECDPETKRITKIVNAALTAIPATHHTPALVAAAARRTLKPAPTDGGARYAARRIAEREMRRRTIMASFDPATMTPAAAHKTVAKVAVALGLDDPEHADHDTIVKSLNAVFAIITGDGSGSDTESVEENALRKQLTASELKACRAQKCSVRDFLAVKASLTRGRRAGR